MLLSVKYILKLSSQLLFLLLFRNSATAQIKDTSTVLKIGSYERVAPAEQGYLLNIYSHNQFYLRESSCYGSTFCGTWQLSHDTLHLYWKNFALAHTPVGDTILLIDESATFQISGLKLVYLGPRMEQYGDTWGSFLFYSEKHQKPRPKRCWWEDLMYLYHKQVPQ